MNSAYFWECLQSKLESNDLPSVHFRVLCPGGGGGGYFRNFWVGMRRQDPGTLNLYQS